MTTGKSADPVFRTDQIGSLIRPAELLDARDDYKAGRIDRAAQSAAEDKAIIDKLELQRQAGVEVFTDGEFRRDGYQTIISEAVEGFAAEYPVQNDVRPDGTVVQVVHHSKPITGKLKRHRRLAKTDADFLKQHAPGPFKITLISPAFVAWRGYKAGVTDKAYPDKGELLNDLVNIISDEMRDLATDGTPYIQLDMGFAQYARDEVHEKAKAEGIDLDAHIEKYIEAENRCYAAARRPGVTFGMHVCRGNRNAFNQARGSYEWLAERLFGRLDVDRFLLEYDSDRAGGLEPLRFLPRGKVVVLGLVSSKNPALESVDELRRKVDEAASYCSYEQLALSAQCGFHGAADRDAMHMTQDDEKRKLALIAETAHRIWS